MFPSGVVVARVALTALAALGCSRGDPFEPIAPNVAPVDRPAAAAGGAGPAADGGAGGAPGTGGAGPGRPDATAGASDAGSSRDAGAARDVPGGEAAPARDAGVVPDMAPPTATPVARPFGSRPAPYRAGTIRPSGAPAVLDAAVAAFYDRWKAAYLTEGCGGAYVKAPQVSSRGMRASNSHVHGLGMLLTALMAGHDAGARATFDGFVAVFRRFTSTLDSSSRPGNRNLMGYGFDPMCMAFPDGDAQTDGDLAIAYALLLAHRQWGVGGRFDYLGQARATIAAIKAYEMNPTSKAPLLGDWCSVAGEDLVNKNATHPADFAFDHFRAFAAATGDAFWAESVDAGYDLVRRFQAAHSPMTGLLPEYMLETTGEPAPPPGPFLTEPNGNAFTPDTVLSLFRFASDHAITGDDRGKQALAPVNTWIKSATGGDPARIVRGYRLDGTPLSTAGAREYEAAFAAAALVDATHQAWLDALWQRLVDAPLEAAFPDTVRLLSLILVTGNWWVP